MTTHEPEPAPELKSWWFYTSAIPLDDPLCPLPQSSAPPTAPKHPPRPFSENDTKSLEDAYQAYLKESAEPKTPKPKRHLSSTLAYLGKPTNRRNHSYNSGSDHGEKKEHAEEGKTRIRGAHSGFEKDKEVTGSGIVIDLTKDSPSKVNDTIFKIENRMRPKSPESTRRSFSPSAMRGRLSPISASPVQPSPIAQQQQPTQPSPFTRMPSKQFVPVAPTRPELQKRASSVSPDYAHKRRRPSFSSEVSVEGESYTLPNDAEKEVVVGAQRLHKVTIPSFTLMPVYWEPLNDIAPVIRGTWFFRDTMLPVESEIANRLETGYMELRAWSDEWKAELDSALEVGWEGEEKIRWPLFEHLSRPSSKEDNVGSSSNTLMSQNKPASLSNSMFSKRKDSFSGSAAPPVSSAVQVEAVPSRVATWAAQNDWVIFADGKTAFIGRDSLLSFGNKRPLQSIKKGKTVGTAVVRGFDARLWVRLRPKESALVLSRTTEDLHRTTSATSPAMAELHKVSSNHSRDQKLLIEREVAKESTNITDLVLVIHGIGQKLSEKFESFHFTHAVNHFRRLINMELQEPSVKATLRSPNVGVMVLPVNWRSKVSFDDGTPAPEFVHEQNKFGLSDITPNSIPAVRDFVGDVMLDIPYYLSHHKKKIIQAVVAEANRVYRLWCQNNPVFLRDGGRVHIIAHSLGCAIALDILSSQPDRLNGVAQSIDLDFRGRRTPMGRVPRAMPPAEERFEFDTYNLFTCGSPAGFFLLLHKGKWFGVVS